MLRRKVLDQAGMFDLNLEALQDYDLWIRCCLVTKVDFVPEPCINYYNAAENKQVSSNTEKYIHARLYIREKYRDEIAKFGKEFEQKVDIIVENRIAERCLRNGQNRAARHHALKAWKIRPSKSISHAAGGFSVSVIIYCKDPQRHKKPQSLLADQENVVIIMKEKLIRAAAFVLNGFYSLFKLLPVQKKNYVYIETEQQACLWIISL